MKIKILSSAALALLLTLAPLAAQAAVPTFRDPGSIPIDEILKSEEPFTPAVKKVFDSGQILTTSEEDNLENILQKVGENYGVEVIVEYVRTFPFSDSEAWSNDRAAQLGLGESQGPALYLNISIDDRSFWAIPNSKFSSGVSGDQINLVLNRFAVPEFKENRWVRGMAILAEDLSRTYDGLPLFDTSTTVPENSNVIPIPASTAPTTTEDTRTPEEKAADIESAQEKLGGAPADSSNSEEPAVSSEPPADNGAVVGGFLWVIGGLVVLGVLVGVIVTIVKLIQSAAMKKRDALKILEDKRLQRLVDQLVPRLRHSDEFLEAESDEVRLKVAEKASFAVFGLKAADKDTVLKLASDYVHREKESGLPPSDSIDSTELMNLSIKALAEKDRKNK